MSGKTVLHTQTFNITSKDVYSGTFNNPINLNYDLLAARFDIKNLNCTYAQQDIYSQTITLVFGGCDSVQIMYGHGYPTNVTVKRTCLYFSTNNSRNGSTYITYGYQCLNVSSKFDYNQTLLTNTTLALTVWGAKTISALSGTIAITLYGINL